MIYTPVVAFFLFALFLVVLKIPGLAKKSVEDIWKENRKDLGRKIEMYWEKTLSYPGAWTSDNGALVKDCGANLSD